LASFSVSLPLRVASRRTLTELSGPTIGGFLSQPAKQWPNIFGSFQLFLDYPYSLPCLVTGLYIFITLVLCVFYLKEVSPAPRLPYMTRDQF
jgi:hypothetical protein